MPENMVAALISVPLVYMVAAIYNYYKPKKRWLLPKAFDILFFYFFAILTMVVILVIFSAFVVAKVSLLDTAKAIFPE